MCFAKAQDLLRLAQMAASRREGISLEDIRAEFNVSHRTAQRMTEALDAAVPGNYYNCLLSLLQYFINTFFVLYFSRLSQKEKWHTLIIVCVFRRSLYTVDTRHRRLPVP